MNHILLPLLNDHIYFDFIDRTEDVEAWRRSARGPLHAAAAQDVNVDVVDRLAAVGTVVDDDPVAFGQARLCSAFFGHDQQVAQELTGEVVDRVHVVKQQHKHCIWSYMR